MSAVRTWCIGHDLVLELEARKVIGKGQSEKEGEEEW
jgi:hypothetical protein